jgi:riboflavin synthase
MPSNGNDEFQLHPVNISRKSPPATAASNPFSRRHVVQPVFITQILVPGSINRKQIKHQSLIYNPQFSPSSLSYLPSHPPLPTTFTMFTGLVETLGTISSLTPIDSTTSGGNGTSLTISDCALILTDAHLGDSISVNGTCLTITSFTSESFKVGVAPETLRRTNLGRLKEGSKCNLERAVRADTRMGGHFVQGHVDTVATISQKRPDGNAVVFRLKPREGSVLRYVVEKGYVTLDGASLTVTAVNDGEGWFEVMLIAYTQERVVMAGKREGEEVNVEIDVVGKMVERSVEGYFEDKEREGGLGGGPSVLEKMVGRIVALQGTGKG